MLVEEEEEEEAVAACSSQSGRGSHSSSDGLEFREKKLKPQMRLFLTVLSACLFQSKHPSVDPLKSRAGHSLRSTGGVGLRI